ncbi:hypothetical protein C1Y63_06810 [Corynebacterium sp. 13CS0277]|uniref:hypothetical protein n=1 Tax=Corynebacterium sp. 13CS0277 TaxID=2071994 RepID=UPI000D03796B|nr:hypothetical protein [Corynebacterium sp. 13CS0277]PRQ11257.1 hypothetical protein C1Y63_06810 [Corynebacterium sp. 13CS0277]
MHHRPLRLLTASVLTALALGVSANPAMALSATDARALEELRKDVAGPAPTCDFLKSQLKPVKNKTYTGFLDNLSIYYRPLKTATPSEQAEYKRLTDRADRIWATQAVVCGLVTDDRDLGTKIQDFVGSGDAGSGLGSLEKLFGSSGLSS